VVRTGSGDSNGKKSTENVVALKLAAPAVAPARSFQDIERRALGIDDRADYRLKGASTGALLASALAPGYSDQVLVGGLHHAADQLLMFAEHAQSEDGRDLDPEILRNGARASSDACEHSRKCRQGARCEMNRELEEIDWDDRQLELTAALQDKRLSNDAREALAAFAKEGDAFNEAAQPSGGFGSEAEMNDVLGPAEEGETAVAIALRRVLEGVEPESSLTSSIAKCRRLYVRGLAKRKQA